MSLSKDFELWTFKQCCHCDRQWGLLKLDSMNSALCYDYTLMGPEIEYDDLNKNGLHSSIRRDTIMGYTFFEL